MRWLCNILEDQVERINNASYIFLQNETSIPLLEILKLREMNNTLIKGLRLLEVLAARTQALGVSELAHELEMGASNVHRLLQALVETGYVVNEGGRGGYRAT